MTGTFEYEKGDKRDVPDFNVFFRYNATYPYYSDAIWYLTQMRRWGQIAEAKADAWYAETAKSVYRPDIYLKAAQAAGRRGQGDEGRLPLRQRRLPARRPPTSSTASPTTASKPNAYIDCADDRPEGPARRSTAPTSSAADLRTRGPARSRRPSSHSPTIKDRIRTMADATATFDDSASRRAAHAKSCSTAINKASGWLDALGFGWLTPLLKIAAGDNPARAAARAEARAGHSADRHRRCSWPPGQCLRRRSRPRSAPFPARSQVWEQAVNLWADHLARAPEGRRILRAPGRAQRQARRRRQGRQGQVAQPTPASRPISTRSSPRCSPSASAS